jgi:hypothetical protein
MMLTPLARDPNERSGATRARSFKKASVAASLTPLVSAGMTAISPCHRWIWFPGKDLACHFEERGEAIPRR